MAAKSVSQEESDVNFELHIHSHCENHHYHDANNGNSQRNIRTVNCRKITERIHLLNSHLNTH